MDSKAIWVTVASSLVSGLIGVLVSTYYYRRYERRKVKFNTLRRLAGARYCLSPGASDSSKKEFFEALNEVFVVFHDDEDVLAVLEVFHKELNIPGRLFDNIVKLFRAINRNLGIEYKTLTDDFMLRPFTPPVELPHNKIAQVGSPPSSSTP
jgi:hypothetical protein